ncbi:hypothetical protein ABK040_015037 [Willaertia magna]
MFSNQITNHSEHEKKILNKLLSYHQQSSQYTDEQLKLKARSIIPVDNLHQKAEQAYKEQKLLRPNDSNVILERFIIKELLAWFKNEFFKWVNNPPCEHCQSTNTQLIGGVAPNQYEQQGLAGVVELYQCSQCNKQTRFPRYNHAGRLLETRKGRCGEWAQCFTLCCNAIGYEARFVVDFTDHVWTEVYLDGKWVHADSCENVLDAPLMYSEGWGKKLSYVFGFTTEEIVDVTKRYTNHFYEKDFQERRRKEGISEEWLEKCLEQLNSQLKIFMPPYRSQFIQKRQERERLELNEKYKNLTSSLLKPEEQQGRISGSQEWKEMRGETGKKITSSSSSSSSSTCTETSCTTAPPFTLDPTLRTELTNKLKDKKELLTHQDKLTTVGHCKLLNNICILTDNSTSQLGALHYKELIDKESLFTNGLIHFTFQVIKTGSGADGFSFIIHSNNDKEDIIGEAGCGLGYQGIPNCLAIEFDTYQTFDRTRDPDSNHISIHTRFNQPNSAHHDYSLACTTSLPFSLSDGLIHQCSLLFIDKKLSVILDNEYLVLRNVLIDSDRIFSNANQVKLGFTASTGGLCEKHIIAQWSITLQKSQSVSLQNVFLYEQANTQGIEKKLREFNALTDTTPKFSENEIQSLLKIENWSLKECQLILSAIKKWKVEHLFPIIDLLRITFVKSKYVADLYSKLFVQNQKEHLLAFLLDRTKEFLNVMNQTTTTVMEQSVYSFTLVFYRLICNLFKEKLSKVYANKFAERLITELTEENSYLSLNNVNNNNNSKKVTIRQGWITIFVNYSYLFSYENPDEEYRVRILYIINEFIQNEISTTKDLECLFKSLLALYQVLKLDKKNEEDMVQGLALSLDLIPTMEKVKSIIVNLNCENNSNNTTNNTANMVIMKEQALELIEKIISSQQ